MFGKNKSSGLGLALLSIVLLLTVGLLTTACGGGGTVPKAAAVYKVYFNADGGEPIPEPQLVPEGGKVELPEGMKRDKSSFKGWYKDAGCEEPWDFDKDIVEQDIVLFAGWGSGASKGGGGGGGSTPKTSTPAVTSYTVTFNSMGGVAVPAKTVNENSTFTATTTRDPGWYDFGGWYTERELINEWLPTDPVTGNITLYAKWIPLKDVGEDPGPGGGIIYYVDKTDAGFTLYLNKNDTLGISGHYLEAAQDNIPGLIWSTAPGGTYTVDGLSTSPDTSDQEIGRGRQNTDIIIIDGNNHSYTTPAASACVDPYNNAGGSKTDWHLPSLGELEELWKFYDDNGGAGCANLTFGSYHSSSQFSLNRTYGILFTPGTDNGDQTMFAKEASTGSVRPVRAF